jgi:ankyrin repeat protein
LDDGMTALMLAATVGAADAVKLLLSHGADVTAKSHSGQTALALATEPEVIEALQEATARHSEAEHSRWLAAQRKRRRPSPRVDL